MSYFLDNWGSVVGIVGVIVGLIGVGFSVAAFYRAGKARDAAEAASKQTGTAIALVLTTVDLERAIALVQRLKGLSWDGRWEISLEHYQPLRVMLSNIRSRHPAPTPELQRQLEQSILQITYVENTVYQAVIVDSEPPERLMFNMMLNDIQVHLEEIASSIYSSENWPSR